MTSWLAGPMRRTWLTLGAVFAFLIPGVTPAQVLPTHERIYEVWTPRQWQPKLLNFVGDKNQNFVEDMIEAMPSTERVQVLLDLNDCPSAADLNRFAQFGKVRYVGRYLTVVCLTDVLVSDAVRLGFDDKVAMVELDHQVQAMLDVSTRNIRVRASPTYSPNTVQDMYPGLTGAGVNIAILDTGVDDGVHESIPAAKFVGGFNAFTMLEGNPDDDHGHGTHVAGTALGTGGVAGTYQGVAPGAGLVDIKVLDSLGNGTAAGVLAGMEKCIQRRVAWNIGVANVSLGGCVPSNGSDALSQAVNRMVMADIVVCVAMGNTPNCGLPNNTSQVNSPTAADDAISVAASDDHNAVNRALSTFATYSFIGPRTSDGDADPSDEMKPDVTAPGTAIISAQFNTAAGYVSFSGTSQATPHVAGLAALIRQAAPAMSPYSVRKLIRDTAEDKGAAGYDNFWGYGLVNGFAALNQLFATAKTDLRFVENCNSPNPANWLSADLFPVVPAVVEGTPNTIQANIHNNGANAAVNFQVRIGAYYFSNGDLNYNICTVNVPGPLAPGATMPVTCPWTPSVSGPPPGTVHACLKAEIVTPFDTDYANNCAQHNINIQQTASPAHFHMRVVNPTGLDLTIVLSNDLPRQSKWTLEQTATTFTMAANDCPQDVDFYLNPPAGVPGEQQVNIQVLGFSADPPKMFQLGGVSIKGFTARANSPPSAASDAYGFVPNKTLSVQAPGVLGNDSDPDADPLLAVLVAPAQHGNVMLQADGSFIYTPEADYAGSDSFVYQASDGLARSLETIVSLNPIQVPGVAIAPHTNGQVLICWPDPSLGWVLQCATNLTPPIRWQDVNLPTVIIGGRKCVIIDPAGRPAAFYRLHLQQQLPIFKVTGPGVTPAQFEILSSMLRLPPEAYGQDGSVRFTDPQRFQALPTEVLDQSFSEEDKMEVVNEGFLFDQINQITVPDDATARSLVRNALGQTGLTPSAPYRMTEQIGHSMFQAVDDKGTDLANQPLDTQVHHTFELGGLPVVGPGARVNLIFNGAQEATRVTYALRQIEPSDMMPVLEGSEAEVMAMDAYQGTADGNGKLYLSSRLVYFAPPTDQTSVRTILPYYEFGGTLVTSGKDPQPVQLRRLLIPAVRDPRFLPTASISGKQEGNSIQARAIVTGGTPPYAYQWSSSTGSLDPTNSPDVSYTVTQGKESTVVETLTLIVTDANGVPVNASENFVIFNIGLFAPRAPKAAGTLDVGTEWVGTSMGLSGSSANANGFMVRFLLDNIFGGGSTVLRFNWGDYNAWERDFKDPALGGNDGNWADNVDALFYTGHANGNGWSFPGSHDDGFLSNTEARYGNNVDLEWITIAACGPLQEGAVGSRWYQRWGPAFRGLHLLCGYQTVTYDNTVEGTKWADYMVRGWTVRQAWMQTGLDVQGASERVAVMGVIGPSGSANWNDHYWGKGTTGPDILDVRGWWMVSSPCD